MTKMRYMLVGWMLIQIFSIISIPIAHAGLGVSELIFDAVVAPGENVRHEMIVGSEPTDPPMDILIDVRGFGQLIEGVNIDVNPELDKSPYTARSFLKVSPASFHLEPGQEKGVLIEGNVPKDVGAGGRYAMVNIHSLPMGNGSIGVSLAVNAPVRLSISGTNLIKSGIITDLKLKDAPSRKNQNLSLTFENTGNIHYKALATAILKDKSGQNIAEVSTPMSFSFIIPTMLREFEIQLSPEKELRPGEYNISTSVSLEDRTVLATKDISFTV